MASIWSPESRKIYSAWPFQSAFLRQLFWYSDQIIFFSTWKFLCKIKLWDLGDIFFFDRTVVPIHIKKLTGFIKAQILRSQRNKHCIQCCFLTLKAGVKKKWYKMTGDTLHFVRKKKKSVFGAKYLNFHKNSRFFSSKITLTRPIWRR